MDNKAKIILNRPSQWLNRLRKYRIFLNGKQVGSVKNGAAEEFAAEPGNNSIECKLDWCCSRPFAINLKEGETAYLKVRSGMKLFWAFYIPLIVGVIMVFYFQRKPDKPEWAMPVSIVLVVPAAIYLLYYTTFGRKDYLVVEKDTKNIFA